MKLASDGVYPHDEHGEVLVIDIHHVFDKYDVESTNGRLRSRVVRFATDWDDYGPMSSSIRVVPVDEFRDDVGERIRAVEFLEPEK